MIQRSRLKCTSEKDREMCVNFMVLLILWTDEVCQVLKGMLRNEKAAHKAILSYQTLYAVAMNPETV